MVWKLHSTQLVSSRDEILDRCSSNTVGDVIQRKGFTEVEVWYTCSKAAASQYRTEMSSTVCCGSDAQSGRLVHISFCCCKDGIVEDIR